MALKFGGSGNSGGLHGEGGGSGGGGIRRPPPTGEVMPGRHRPVKPELDEGPSLDDIERFRHATVKCPHCKKEVFDDVDICYHCNMAIVKQQTSPKPWVVITAIVLLVVLTIFLLQLKI
jgi:hypothetical protein